MRRKGMVPLVLIMVGCRAEEVSDSADSVADTTSDGEGVQSGDDDSGDHGGSAGESGSDSDGGSDGQGDGAPLPTIDCPSTCEQVLPLFCPNEMITSACLETCEADNALIAMKGPACAEAYSPWFMCVLIEYETAPDETCAMAVAWHEHHELPAPDTVCFTELSAFVDACEFEVG